MILNCSNLVYGVTLKYTRSDMVLGLKGQSQTSKVKVAVTLNNDTSFQTTIVLHCHSLGGNTDKSNTAWVRTVRVHYSCLTDYVQFMRHLLGRATINTPPITFCYRFVSNFRLSCSGARRRTFSNFSYTISFVIDRTLFLLR